MNETPTCISPSSPIPWPKQSQSACLRGSNYSIESAALLLTGQRMPINWSTVILGLLIYCWRLVAIPYCSGYYAITLLLFDVKNLNLFKQRPILKDAPSKIKRYKTDVDIRQGTEDRTELCKQLLKGHIIALGKICDTIYGSPRKVGQLWANLRATRYITVLVGLDDPKQTVVPKPFPKSLEADVGCFRVRLYLRQVHEGHCLDYEAVSRVGTPGVSGSILLDQLSFLPDWQNKFHFQLRYIDYGMYQYFQK